MAVFASGVHVFEREFIRAIQPRDSATISSAPSPSPSHSPVNVHLATSVKALAGAFTVIGLIILATAAWKFCSWRKRRNGSAPSSQFDASSMEKGMSEKQKFHASLIDIKVERPNKAVLLPPVPSTPSVGWVPQIRSVHVPKSGVSIPPIAMTGATRSPQNKEEFVNTSDERNCSPPPKYSLPLPPPPPFTAPPAVPPPTPPASRKLSVTVAPPPPETFDLPPLPSPRSTSISNFPSAATAKVSRTSFIAMLSPKALPRLMTVATAFTPTMDDELLVRAGETLRLLEEFEDEWCLVQRVGRADAEKGVIPRFCLQERPRVVPPQRVTFSTFHFGHSAQRK
ncbi:hypothetical protein EW146_g7839 [Bondarzewia mesenterica]|uniref:SH3 domain-containing protein n=1 Tax=Bondarzewia mesenterica TaxID=1095465 RepID=A0A4S4LJ29_9AGAM|nr:hypothetical protein EW146_g7839 [Bondarzewia mesenterica]